MELGVTANTTQGPADSGGRIAGHSHPLPCAERMRAAAGLGAQRRRVFLVSTLLSLAVPVLPYLTGTWETLWYGLAATSWPLALRAALFVVAFELLAALVLLPVSYYSGFVLAHAFGLSRQTLSAWLLDWAKGLLVGAVLGLLGAGAFLWSVVQFGHGWWWVFGLLASTATILMVFVTPYVLVPLFSRMRPIEDRETSERILALAQRAGAEVKEIDSLDFSRRTAEANAAVIGFGRSRRVILADTLLADFPPSEVDAVVAHELGHHVHRDVPRLMVFYLALQWIGLLLAATFEPLALPILSVPSLAYVPGFPMLYAVAEAYLLLLSPLSAWWSRRLEATADRFALRVTRDPAAFASAMRRLACQNLVELWPPRWAEVLLGSHPSVGRRIAAAEAVQ